MSSVIRLIRFFLTKRVVGRKTSPREERANDANAGGPKPKVPGEKPHCFSSPRGWRARENLTKTPSKRATGGYDDAGGKRSGKLEGRKRYAGTDKPENRYSKPGACGGSFSCQTVDNESFRCEMWRYVDYSIVNWRAKEKKIEKRIKKLIREQIRDRQRRYGLSFSLRRLDWASMKFKTFTRCPFLFLSLLSLRLLVRSPFILFLFLSLFSFTVLSAANEKHTKRHLARPLCLALTRRSGCRLISRWLIKNSFVFVARADGAAHLHSLGTSRNGYARMDRRRCKRWND